MLPQDCQIHSVAKMGEGEAELEPMTLPSQVRLLLKRVVPHKTKRQLKRFISRHFSFLSRDGKETDLPVVQTAAPALAAALPSNGGQQVNVIPLQTIDLEMPMPVADSAKSTTFKAGDQVRVRPYEEIAATIDQWSELRGCKFMPEMREYCGTTQRVFKSVERMVDERDYKVKKVKGVLLLEGLVCGGTESYGRCDRACFYFWREEWLERVE